MCACERGCAICVQVLRFVRRILHGTGAGPAAARALGPLLLGALGRGLLTGNAAQRSLALPLLIDACEALRPEVRRCSSTTAHPQFYCNAPLHALAHTRFKLVHLMFCSGVLFTLPSSLVI